MPTKSRTIGGLTAALSLIAALLLSVTAGVSKASADPDPQNWFQQSPQTNPPALIDPSMAYDAASDQMILTGYVAGDPVDETWLWAGGNWTQLSPDDSPPARSGAAMAYDPGSSDVVLFGGLSSSGQVLGDTWTWDGTTWASNSAAPSPSARQGADMAYDVASSQLILFGGEAGDGSYLNDTYVWNGSAWQAETPSLPGNFDGKAYSPLAYDPSIGELVFFSGAAASTQIFDDTWGWDGSNWSQLAPESTPGAIYGHAFVYDPSTDQTILFGGAMEGSPVYYSETESFANPSGFANLDPANSPSPRTLAAVAYDPDTQDLLLFGGYDGSYHNDTWLYGTGIPTVTAALSTTTQTVAAVESVPESAIPASAVDGSTGSGSGDAASAPLSSIPLHSIGLSSTPLASIPLHSIPLHSIADPGTSSLPTGLALAQQALQSTLLSDISISYPAGCGSAGAPACTGWAGVLAGTAYQDVPLESVTLADVLSDPVASVQFDSVDLASLDLSSSPLQSVPLSSIELGDTPLSSIGVDGSASGNSAVQAWCDALSSVGSSCAAFGIDSTDSTTEVNLLTLALAGVPLHSIPLSSIPLHSIDLSTSPLASVPLSSIDLEANPLHSIPLHSIPLDSIPLHSIPLSSISDLSSIVDCTVYPECDTATLGDAYDAGAILSGATIGDLTDFDGTTVGQLLIGDSTTDSDYPALTLGDLLLTTVPPDSYQWQSVDLSTTPLASAEASGGTGGTVTYNAAISEANSTSAFDVSVTLPPSFAYVPGTASLDGMAVADPTTATGLDWSLPALSAGTHTFQFKANAGVGLGVATTSLVAALSDGTASADASTEVNVIDGEEPAISSTSTPFPLSAGDLATDPPTQGSLNLGYLDYAGDVNDWSVTVPAGGELSLALTDLPATYDLELFGPIAQQIQGSPNQNVGGVTDTVPTLAAGTTSESTPGSQDIPVTPPAGDQLLALSNNPSAQGQYIQTTPLSAGTYTVQVSGYAGAFSSSPYLLQANILGGQTAPSCPSGIGYTAGLGSIPAASGPVSIPSGVNTLFLVDTQRLTASYGAQAEQQIMTQLSQVASDSAAGVVGAAVPVDAYASVQSAYAVWNSDPCSVAAANGVAAAISTVVDEIRADNPSVQNLVIVGPDDQIPFARVADGATEANERDYGEASFAGENNVEADALDLGYYFSDDPYAAADPLGVGSATLYLPQVAVGRLVESAAEIEDTLTRFVSTSGVLDASASLTTGYSFLTAGAQAVSANLAADGLSPSTLINESWQESDLDTALAASPTPTVDSINAHFDYSRALPAYDNANNSTSNLFTTEDVRNPPIPTSYSGRLLFSMGCHAGLSIDSAEVATSGVATPVDDWTKTFADSGALWIANTGYGYADSDTIAYSARLMSTFAGNLNGSLTVGEALAEAKQQYAAGNAILSPYDLKALMESTLYGLPMYRLNSSPVASPGRPAAPPTGHRALGTTTDPVTGLPVDDVSVSLSQGTGAGQLGLISTPNGSYYQVNPIGTATPGTQTTEYRPIEPLVSVPATQADLVPHGALLTGLASSDITGFTPAYSKPAVGSDDSTSSVIDDAAFPGTLQRVATFGTFTPTGTGTGAQLDLVAGQFIPDAAMSGVGTQRLYSSISAQVFYDPPTSALAQDFVPTTIDSSTASASNTQAVFSAQTTPSSNADPTVEVVVLYTDGANPGAWTETTLTSTDGESWSGAGPATPSGLVQYVVEAVDAAGNVAVSNNEGTDYVQVAPPTLSISLVGQGPVDGFYTGAVTVSISAASGSTYTLDGSPAAPVPSSGQVVVGAPGEHTVTVTGPSDATVSRTFVISTFQTLTALSTGANPAMLDAPVLLQAQVVPATEGAGTPGGAVEFLDGSTPLAACGGSVGEPVGGMGLATCTPSFSSPGNHPLSAVYLGDTTFAGSSTPSPINELVDQTATATTLTGPVTPVATGKPVTFTATVSTLVTGAGQPGGYVEFLNGAKPIQACGGTAGEPISGAGQAACRVTPTVPGYHSFGAVYLGSGPFAPSTAATVKIRNDGPTATTTAVTSSRNPVVEGQTVTFAARVSLSPTGVGPLRGDVEFTVGGQAVASCGGPGGIALVSGHPVTCRLSFSQVGQYSIAAQFLGAGPFLPSGSNQLDETVNPKLRPLSGAQVHQVERLDELKLIGGHF